MSKARQRVYHWGILRRQSLRIMTAPPTSSILRVDSSVPYDGLIRDWLAWPPRPAESIIKPSRRYEKPYLAWETVRRRRNPFFEKGTGFEGYFIGRTRNAEEALEHILGVGQNILDNIARQQRGNYPYQSRMMQTLLGEREDARAVYDWSAELGAALARLRVNVPHNPDAQTFHTDTYRLVNMLPAIVYQAETDDILQRYMVAGSNNGGQRLPITVQSLPAARQHAWLVALFIGRFGHPLVRQYLSFNPPH